MGKKTDAQRRKELDALISDFKNFENKARQNLDNIIQNAQQVLNDITQNIQPGINSAKQNIDGFKNQAQQVLDDITQNIEPGINSAKQNIDDFKNQAQQVLNDITQNIQPGINSAKQNIDGFFIDAQKQDKRRRAELDIFFKELTQQKNDIETQKKEIEETTKKANDMLSRATNAGLGGHFNKIREDIEKKLKNMRRTYYRAIGFLAISVIGIFVYFLSSGASMEAQTFGFFSFIHYALTRAVILLPSIIMVVFVSRQYNILFKLHEDYCYKYSMAVAVEGFKKQAPQYEDEIAALVLQELAFNPGDGLFRTKQNENQKKGILRRVLEDKIPQKTQSPKEATQDAGKTSK